MYFATDSVNILDLFLAFETSVNLEINMLKDYSFNGSLIHIYWKICVQLLRTAHNYFSHLDKTSSQEIFLCNLMVRGILFVTPILRPCSYYRYNFIL